LVIVKEDAVILTNAADVPLPGEDNRRELLRTKGSPDRVSKSRCVGPIREESRGLSARDSLDRSIRDEGVGRRMPH
jgi:hypothetical protein